eukprot:scaffold15669_cov34-Tisochrysis_lutea.AAC.2
METEAAGARSRRKLPILGIALVTAGLGVVLFIHARPHDRDDQGPAPAAEMLAAAEALRLSAKYLCTNTCSAYLQHLRDAGVTDYSGDNACDDGGPGSDWGACDLGTDCKDCGQRYILGESDSEQWSSQLHTPVPAPPPPLAVPTYGSMHGASTTTITLFKGVGGAPGVPIFKSDNIRLAKGAADHHKEIGMAMDNVMKVSQKYGLDIEILPPPPPPPGALAIMGAHMWKGAQSVGRFAMNQLTSPAPPPPGIAAQLKAQMYRQQGYQPGFDAG